MVAKHGRFKEGRGTVQEDEDRICRGLWLGILPACAEVDVWLGFDRHTGKRDKAQADAELALKFHTHDAASSFVR